MASQLRHAGHDVHEASLGSEGLERVTALTPDLAIIDVSLPDTDGITLCRQIKENPATRDTFVLLVSSIRTHSDDQADGLESGAEGYVRRPVSEREFLARVEGLLRLKRAEDALRAVQADLEEQVAERTTHLSQSLARLHGEIAARRQAEEHRAQLETALRQARTMDALGNLAAGTSLDFNNILTGILGWTALARADLPPGCGAAPKLDAIADLCEQARRLTARLLSFSRPDAPNRKPLCLRQLLEGELTVLRATLPAGIEIRPHFDTPIPPVFADPVQIHQVLLALATNASQAMDGQGFLTLRLDAVDLPADLPAAPPGFHAGPHVRLSVSDTGCGMSATVVERIFEPFFTTRDRTRAAGLGLSLAHTIVRHHDGLILVESEPGRGTTFQILLPVSRHQPGEPAPSYSPTPPSPAPPRRPRVLLLDDQHVLVMICSEALQRSGYQTVGFSQPSEALQALEDQGQDADIAITDLSMPGMNGLEFASRVHRFRPKLPIVLITGDPTSIHPEHLAAAGIHRILLKPFTPTELVQTVAETLQRATS